MDERKEYFEWEWDYSCLLGSVNWALLLEGSQRLKKKPKLPTLCADNHLTVRLHHWKWLPSCFLPTRLLHLTLQYKPASQQTRRAQPTTPLLRRLLTFHHYSSSPSSTLSAVRNRLLSLLATRYLYPVRIYLTFFDQESPPLLIPYPHSLPYQSRPAGANANANAPLPPRNLATHR